MKKRQALVLAVLALGSMAVRAHGGDERARRHSYDASQVEETEFGREGDPTKVTRTIRIAMADTMRYSPAQVTIRRGQTVRFVMHNRGKLLHEMVLGTPEAIEAHAELMKRFPQMEHSEPNMAHVEPAATGQIVWEFTQAGEFRFACLQPGHYEAGMVGRVSVK